jgi:hypothetical protein
MEEKFIQFRNLIGEIIAPYNVDMATLLFDIRSNCVLGLKNKKKEIIKILERCLHDLRDVVGDR